GFFNGDHAVFADFLHSFGNDAANGFIVVGGNGADLGNHVAGDRLGQAVKKAFVAVAFFVDGAADGGNGLLNAALQGHRIGAGGHSLYAFAEDGLGQNGGGSGAVAGYVTGLAGDFAHHLCAHVLQGVFKFDFFGHGHTVFGDGGRAKLLFNNNVAAFGTERN